MAVDRAIMLGFAKHFSQYHSDLSVMGLMHLWKTKPSLFINSVHHHADDIIMSRKPHVHPVPWRNIVS